MDDGGDYAILDADRHIIGEAICRVATTLRIDARANAALWAAAPNMFAALAMVEWVSRTGSGGEFCPWCYGLYPEHQRTCARQAALAKVRGKE
jgi:hypothetical protein